MFDKGEPLNITPSARCEGKPRSIGNVFGFWASVLYHEVLRVHRREGGREDEAAKARLRRAKISLVGFPNKLPSCHGI